MMYYCINQEVCGFARRTVEPDPELEEEGCPDCYDIVLPYLDSETPTWINSDQEIEDDIVAEIEKASLYRPSRIFSSKKSSAL
jgi:hypothetical protein